ncbi:MAG: DUF1573 domain-containing protein [Bacteroidota bacterium]
MNSCKLKTALQFGVLVGLLIFQAGCKEEPAKSEDSVEEIQTEGKISSIIRSPISAEGLGDTVNVAKMAFEEAIFDFGEVKEGTVVKHSFKFTNTGKVPLIINNAHSTCGCTVPKWPKDAVAPGESGEITVAFNTQSRQDFQEKPVTITANTYPSNSKVFLRGYVNKALE